MEGATKMALLALATIAVSGATTVLVMRRTIRRRCTSKVVSGCMKVPLASEAFCRDQARTICEGSR